jgi:hypothetical protein
MIKKALKHVEYVCIPSDIKIVAKCFMASKYIYVTASSNKKTGLTGQYSIRHPLTNRSAVDAHIITFCNALESFTDEEIKTYVNIEKQSAARYIHRRLKEVRAKSGLLIWRR